jgi:cytochrome c556
MSAAGSFKSVASVQALMYGQKTFFKQIDAVLKDPSYAERSETIEEAAEVLAELANVNGTKSEKADYRAWATSLRDTALKLAREADKKKTADEAAMARLLQQMGEACAACHDAYQ